MRSLVLGSLAIGLVGVTVVACGDDGGTGGSGGSDTTTTTTSGPTTTASTTKASGSTTTGMMQQCTEITVEELQRLLSEIEPGFFFHATPVFGAADEDSLNLEFYGDPLPTGAVDLATAPNDNYATCTTCLVLSQDITMDGAAKYFFQSAGTLDLGATTAPFITTSLDVTLVEVTIDPETYQSTVVENGECLHVTGGPFTFPEPPAEWTCDSLIYADNEYCDCTDCGVVDPDCEGSLPVYECLEGQTCNTTTFTCEGVPTDWTCADDQYNGGAGNGCDCNCGAPDPDCALKGEAVEGCAMGEICTDAGTCLPSAWTCNPTYYNSGLQTDCDCGCGVVDPDCDDATAASCHYCNDVGSCDETGMDCSAIDTANNAVCMD